MKTKISTKELKAISGKIRAFSDSNYMDKSAKNHTFISCRNGVAKFRVYDTEAYIKINLSYEGEDCDMVLPTYKLIMIINNSTGEFITFDMKKGEVVISFGNKKLKLPDANVQEPVYNKIEDNYIDINLSKEFMELINTSNNLIPKSSLHMWAIGLSFKVHENKFYSFCSDGFYGLLSNMEQGDIVEFDEAFMTGDSINKLAHITDGEEKGTLKIGSESSILKTETIEAFFLGMRVNIPPFLKSFDSIGQDPIQCKLNNKKLQDELKFLLGLYSSIFVHISISRNKLIISGDGFDEVSIDCESTGDGEFNVDPSKLMKLLPKVGDEISLSYGELGRNIKIESQGQNPIIFLAKMN